MEFNATFNSAVSIGSFTASNPSVAGIPSPDLNFTTEAGTPGAAATIQVGTVTTGEPGTSAIITNAGNASAATLNFTIPQGQQGLQGIQGNPGQKGDKGDTGSQGIQGNVGQAATIQVGTVTTGEPGTSASITNSGSTSAATLNFTIPKGDTGGGLPAGGSAGQVATKVDGTNYNVIWSTPSAGGGGVDVQTFSTAGTFTWTKPAGAKVVDFLLVGGGGGAGSGARYATTSNRSGGGGGAGGSQCYIRLSADKLGATESITVGAGGAGGAGVTTDTTPGNAGTAGTATTFANFRAHGGNAGSGGTTTGGTAGTGRTSFMLFNTAFGSNSGAAGNTSMGSSGAIFNSNSFFGSGGGGGAGGIADVTLSRSGGNGSAVTNSVNVSGCNFAIAGGAGGTSGSINGGAGVGYLSTDYWPNGGTGGGGGAYVSGSVGGNGGAGGWPSGGGGGGSASNNGFASGAGGAGAAGFALIITYK